MLIQYQEHCPRLSELDDNQKARVHKIIGSVEETVGLNYLVDCIADGVSAGGDGVLRCYVGFEPSGKAHIGWKVLSLQLKRMLDAEVNVLIFLADWHAWINDKFGGNMAHTFKRLRSIWKTLLGLYLITPQKEMGLVN